MSSKRQKYDAYMALAEKPVLIAVRRGFTGSIPIIMLGSLALIISSLPIDAYQDLMTRLFGSGWADLCGYIKDGTFNVFSVLMTALISYSYASQFAKSYNSADPIIPAIISVGSLMALFGVTREGFSMDNFGVAGIFVAIVTALLATRLYMSLSSLKALRVKALADATISGALQSIIPSAITITFFAAVNELLTAGFRIVDIRTFLSDTLYDLFRMIGSPMLRGILFVLLVQVFWFFGMHGNNILETVAQKMLVGADTTNQTLHAAGQVPTEVFTKSFLDSFVFMGGCGTTLCLILAILLVSRYKNKKRLAVLSILPAIFNINEIVVFGVPVVLNPVYFIPFVGVPILLAVISYFAVVIGLVPPVISTVAWTTPAFLSGYTATHSISGAILDGVNLIVGTLCYVPFVRWSDKIAERQASVQLSMVYSLCSQQNDGGGSGRFLSRRDEIGILSRMLASDLEDALQKEGKTRSSRKPRSNGTPPNGISLYYQPQVDSGGNVVGLEALLRWKHGTYGMIYPPYAIELAEEAGLTGQLGLLILEKACQDISLLIAEGIQNVPVSVNITAVQLAGGNLAESIEKLLEKYQIPPKLLQIEITEQVALAYSGKVRQQISAIKDLGVKLAMDDFGMGHNSILYLKEYDFDCVKLDGALVCDIMKNQSCSCIISSIVLLGKTLGYSVIAEYVECPEQRDKLKGLGVLIYQGYLYSEAIPLDEMRHWIAASQTEHR